MGIVSIEYHMTTIERLSLILILTPHNTPPSPAWGIRGFVIHYIKVWITYVRRAVLRRVTEGCALVLSASFLYFKCRCDGLLITHDTNLSPLQIGALLKIPV